MDPCFFSVERFPPPKAFGFWLQPLTLGHVFLLHEIESPYVGYEGEKRIADALLLTLICCQNHIAARKFLHSRTLPILMRIWCFTLTGAGIVRGLVALEEYLADSLRCPCVRQRIGDDRDLQSPWPYRLLVLLMSTLHLNHEAALELPVVEAWNLWTAHAEAKGELELRTQAEQDLIEYVDRLHLEGKGN